MPNIKYLCIDDQQDRTVGDLLDGIKRAGGPDFERKTPIEVGAQLQDIIKDSKSYPDGYGLILDLRLDMEADENGDKVPYRGPTLAQELRTRMAENGSFSSFPIVLWSIANKFETSYYGEDTSHDLFDAVYGKDGDVTNNPAKVGREMLALAIGYQSLRDAKRKRSSATKLLNLSADDTSGVYAGFLDELTETMKLRATHNPASLILNQLIRPSGLLVGESMIASRLGVDAERSGKGWERIKKEISHVKYNGPFSEGWERWWWFKIENWWTTLSSKSENLRRITAEERVLILNQKFRIKLVEAKPIESDYSTKYFTLCAATQRPLDPINALRVYYPTKKAWHDPKYVSIVAALERTNKETWGRIDPADREQFAAIKGRRA